MGRKLNESVFLCRASALFAISQTSHHSSVERQHFYQQSNRVSSRASEFLSTHLFYSFLYFLTFPTLISNKLLPQVAGDPQILEVELAKLKVLVNDIAAHQASVDTLNDAGAQIVTQGTGTCEPLYAFTYHYSSFN